MKFSPLALCCALLSVAKAPTASGTEESPQWPNLQASLADPSVLLLPDSVAAKWAEECAVQWEGTDFEFAFAVSQYSLNAAPTGLCSNTLSCAFQQCQWPYAPVTGVEYSYEEFVQNVPDAHNLPQAVMFPKTPDDVVSAVKFAKENGLKVSVKAGGNSYAGSHTEKDSLMLYMGRQFQRYSDEGVTPCDAGSASAFDADDAIDKMPCAVAASRGKPGVIAVGGGELFGDTYANALEEKDDAGGKNRYHLIGGGTPTVSPNGWTTGGGLSGNTAGRMLGFGADQVVQLEMVLPLGWRVKFGPSAWEDDPALDFPRVTEVKGWCHMEGKWTDCPAEPDVDFFELWHAVRGGGGGAYGESRLGTIASCTFCHAAPDEMRFCLLCYTSPLLDYIYVHYCCD